jgi:hypothetical protein
MHREANLLEVVGALQVSRRFPCRLHCREQEREQDRDDRDHHQELDQCETRPHDAHSITSWDPMVETRADRTKNRFSWGGASGIPGSGNVLGREFGFSWFEGSAGHVERDISHSLARWN